MIFLSGGILGGAIFFSVFFSINQSAFITSNYYFYDQPQKSNTAREKGAAPRESGRGAAPVADHRPCLLCPGPHAQVVQVNDSMYGFIGTDVVLHCSFANPLPGVKITQVTWQKATNGSKQNVAIYNPAMGVSVLAPYRERVEFLRPSFTDGTIRLSRLELDDEGVYICEFATFPAGNRESQLNLTVMGKLARPPPSLLVQRPGAWGLAILDACLNGPIVLLGLACCPCSRHGASGPFQPGWATVH